MRSIMSSPLCTARLAGGGQDRGIGSHHASKLSHRDIQPLCKAVRGDDVTVADIVEHAHAPCHQFYGQLTSRCSEAVVQPAAFILPPFTREDS
jgi:hypothetical protein